MDRDGQEQLGVVKTFPGLSLRDKMAVNVILGQYTAGGGVGFTLFWALRLRYFSPGRAQNYVEHKSLGMVGPQVSVRFILGYRTWHPGSGVPMPGSSPIELPAQVPGYGS